MSERTTQSAIYRRPDGKAIVEVTKREERILAGRPQVQEFRAHLADLRTQGKRVACVLFGNRVLILQADAQEDGYALGETVRAALEEERGSWVLVETLPDGRVAIVTVAGGMVLHDQIVSADQVSIILRLALSPEHAPYTAIIAGQQPEQAVLDAVASLEQDKVITRHEQRGESVIDTAQLYRRYLLSDPVRAGEYILQRYSSGRARLVFAAVAIGALGLAVFYGWGHYQAAVREEEAARKRAEELQRLARLQKDPARLFAEAAAGGAPMSSLARVGDLMRWAHRIPGWHLGAVSVDGKTLTANLVAHGGTQSALYRALEGVPVRLVSLEEGEAKIQTAWPQPRVAAITSGKRELALVNELYAASRQLPVAGVAFTLKNEGESNAAWSVRKASLSVEPVSVRGMQRMARLLDRPQVMFEGIDCKAVDADLGLNCTIDLRLVSHRGGKS